MKAYVVVSGIMFLSLLLVHAARLIAEGFVVVGNPAFTVSSIFAIVMSAWSWRIFRGLPGDASSAS